jgi:hypothetical protein
MHCNVEEEGSHIPSEDLVLLFKYSWIVLNIDVLIPWKSMLWRREAHFYLIKIRFNTTNVWLAEYVIKFADPAGFILVKSKRFHENK